MVVDTISYAEGSTIYRCYLTSVDVIFWFWRRCLAAFRALRSCTDVSFFGFCLIRFEVGAILASDTVISFAFVAFAANNNSLWLVDFGFTLWAPQQDWSTSKRSDK